MVESVEEQIGTAALELYTTLSAGRYENGQSGVGGGGTQKRGKKGGGEGGGRRRGKEGGE